jgi:hypothetical protein
LPRSSLAAGVAQSRSTTSFSGRAFLACVASLALPLRQSRAVGVGHDEDPLSPVRGADVSRCNPQGARSIPEFMQGPAHSAQPAPRPARDVLDDNEPRAHLADDPAELPPEAGTRSVEPSTPSCPANVLTWEAAADDIHGKESCCACVPDIRDAPVRAGPVLREHAPAELILLYLPRDVAKSGALKAELEPSDAGEERADRVQAVHLSNGTAPIQNSDPNVTSSASSFATCARMPPRHRTSECTRLAPRAASP